MNLQKTKDIVSDTAKKGVDILGKVFLIGAMALVIYSIGAIANAESPKGTHKAAVDQWEVGHRTLIDALHESECTGANLKLIANANDELTLSPDEVKRLSEKKIVECQNLGK